ncbi:hypothetical protein SteCoe_9225 [Stentor coeruleus]|uniref:Uncharacterized protein n=1 Tax=Stentor coeruleus TaxID=5963 RepID=A0A1R2CIA6_9CILI|nr:hypothetical protein SteCoe_9225 [Stentor coeruleus]
MEQVTFNWILQCVSSSSCIIPVLDTTIIRDDRVLCEYTMNDRVLYKTQPSDIVTINQLLAGLITTFTIKNRLKRQGDIVCYISSKVFRESLTLKELKEFNTNYSGLSKITSVQIAKKHFYREPRHYVYQLNYQSEKYIPSFGMKKDNKLIRVDSRDFYEKSRDIARLLLLYIEENKMKKVISITIDLVSDDDYKLWLMDVTDCKVMDMGTLKMYRIDSYKDLKSIPKKKPGFKSFANRTMQGYSCPSFPVIITPEICSSDDEGEKVMGKKEEKIDIPEVPLLFRKNTIFRKELKKKKRGHESDENFRDFLEILSKTFAKYEAENKGREYCDGDIEKEMKRIASILDPEYGNDDPSGLKLNNDRPFTHSPSLVPGYHLKGNLKTNSNVVSRKGSEVSYRRHSNFRIKTSRK